MRYNLINLTDENVAEAINRLIKKHNGRIKIKKKSWVIKAIAKFIPLFSPLSEDEFLTEYTQTLPGVILTNFEPGDTSTGYDHEQQLRIIIHEVGHLDQFNKDPKMAPKYLLRPAIRALLEAECYAMNAGFNYFCRGREYSTEMFMDYADNLIEYSCDAEDIKGAFAAIETHCRMDEEMGEPHLQPLVDMIAILKDLNMLEERV